MKNICLIFFSCLMISSIVFASPFDSLKSKMEADKAAKLIKKGDYEKAVILYESALSKNTNSTELYYNLASALISRGENQNAIEALNIAKKTFNDKTSDKVKNYVYYNSGIAAIEEKNYKLAINELVEALTYNPKDDNARYALEYARKRDKEQNESGKADNNQNNNSENDDNNNSDKNNNSENGQENNSEEKPNSSPKNEKNNEESLTMEDIERLLDSLRNLRKEPKNNEDKNYGGYIEKDW